MFKFPEQFLCFLQEDLLVGLLPAGAQVGQQGNTGHDAKLGMKQPSSVQTLYVALK